jgi:hypothetical protein
MAPGTQEQEALAEAMESFDKMVKDDVHPGLLDN